MKHPPVLLPFTWSTLDRVACLHMGPMTFTEFVVAFDGRIVPIEVKAGAGIDRFMERPRPHPAVRRLAPGEATIACGTAAPGAP